MTREDPWTPWPHPERLGPVSLGGQQDALAAMAHLRDLFVREVQAGASRAQHRPARGGRPVPRPRSVWR